jgi:hypothetical protein
MSDAQIVVLVVVAGYWCWIAAVSIADRRRRRIDLAEYRWPIEREVRS